MAKLIKLIFSLWNKYRSRLWFNFKLNCLLITLIGLIGKFIYLILYRNDLILFVFNLSILLLALAIHWLLFKNGNLVNLSVSHNQHSARSSLGFVKLASKIFLMQVVIYIITIWLMEYLYLQSSANARFAKFSTISIWDYKYHAIINWLILVNLLLILEYYKRYLCVDSLRLAKCIFPKVVSSWQVYIYNMLLGGEFYLRTIGIIIFFVIASVAGFELIAKTNALNSLLLNATLTAFIIFLVFCYFKKTLYKFIDYLVRKYSLNIIMIFSLVCLVSWLIIFGGAQLLFFQLLEFKVFDDLLAFQAPGLTELVGNLAINRSKVQLLSLGLPIILIFMSIDESFMATIKAFKLKEIYLASSIFPIIYTVLTIFIDLDGLLQHLIKNHIGLWLMVLIACLLQWQYRHIHHAFCFFYRKLKDHQSIMVKQKFADTLKKMVSMYFIYLSIYYMFAWFCIEWIITIGGLFALVILLLLFSKALYLSYSMKFNNLRLKSKDLSHDFE